MWSADPAFHSTANPDPDPVSNNTADPYPDPESRTRNTGFKRVRKRVFRREKSALEDDDRLQEAK
jgi:hypothetical protein